MGEIDDLRDQLHRLELAVERLAGKVEALAQVKVADHARMTERIDEIDHKRHNTDVAVRAVHKRLDDLPKAETLRDTVEDVGDLQRWRARVIGMGTGIGALSGIVSGVLVTVISRAIGA